MIKVIEQLEAAHRRVASLKDDRRERRSAVISRTYLATIGEVWAACTNPERVARWSIPVSGELRAGGGYQFEGNAGGSIDRCDPPTGFSASWEFGDEITWIELRL